MVVLVALSAAIVLHVRFLLLLRREHYQTAKALISTEREFSSIFESVRDAVLVLDNDGICLHANPSAQMLLCAHPNSTLVGMRFGSFVVHQDGFFALWNEILNQGSQRGEITLTPEDGREKFAEYTAKTNYTPGKHIIVLRDVTRRKLAEEQVARNLELAECARSEADALRKSTLALTQNLSMDYVLDTLLESLAKLVPCDFAAVLLCETDSRLFLARDLECGDSSRRGSTAPMTLSADHNQFIFKVIKERIAVVISDTTAESEWVNGSDDSPVRSWLGVPLISSDEVLGLLSLGNRTPDAFTGEHIRVAKSLAIPAAVAIQNARLYERASIYGMELGQRVAELDRVERELRLARKGHGLAD